MWVQSLALLGGLRIRLCHELWCRLQNSSNPALLWLWHRLAATAPIRPLGWEPPYATGAALKRQKKEKKIVYSKPLEVCQLQFSFSCPGTGSCGGF